MKAEGRRQKAEGRRQKVSIKLLYSKSGSTIKVLIFV
jgi:hypothetical protein